MEKLYCKVLIFYKIKNEMNTFNTVVYTLSIVDKVRIKTG